MLGAVDAMLGAVDERAEWVEMAGFINVNMVWPDFLWNNAT